MDLKNKSQDELAKIASALKVLTERKKYNYKDFLFPDEGPLRYEEYPKHLEFFAAGATMSERAFIAANRVGKTLAGLYEMVTHARGDYPHWWTGKRYNRPIYGWIAAESGETIKNSIQRDLIGDHGELGTGLIPKDAYARPPLGFAGIGGAYGTYYIKHISGGTSQIEMKTYMQGKNAFEAAKVDVIMLDEECPLDIYIECQMRTLTTKGMVYLTFTPDSGLTDTVLHFYDKPDERFIVNVGWADVPHITPEMMAEMIKKIPPHMIDVKTKGIPYLGTGAIYPLSSDQISYEPFQIPKNWPRAFGFDPGWNKTAALWGAYDAESDCIYLYSEYYEGHKEAALHAKSIRTRGLWIPGIADPYTEYGSKGKDGIGFLPVYEEEGLNLMMANNKDKDGGIFEIYERLSTGRLKVCSTLRNFFYEYRMYRRDDDGKIVKKNDHLMDCMRYLIKHFFEVAIKEPNPSERDEMMARSNRNPNPVTGY